MEDKIFDFAKTKDALGELSADLLAFESALKAKQSLLNAEKQQNADILLQKEQKIAALSKIAEETLTKIETISKHIEEVL